MESVVSTVGILAQIGTVVAAFGVIISLRQLKMQKETTEMQNLLTLVQFLSQPILSEARHKVMDELTTKPCEEWTEADRTYANRVCSSYDLAGLLLRSGAIRSPVFLSSWGESISHQYAILSDYLAKPQGAGESGMRYWKDFTWLVSQLAGDNPTQHLGQSAAGVP